MCNAKGHYEGCECNFGVQTEDGKNRLSEYRKKSQFGKSNPFYGRTHTQSTIQAYSTSKVGSQNPMWKGNYEIDGETYNSAQAAADDIGICKTTVYRRCASVVYTNYNFIPKELTHE